MLYAPVKITAQQERDLEIARVGLMTAAPFYAHYFYSEMKEVYTKDIPTAATDGRRIYINPDYVCGLKPQQRVFVYAHEIEHVILKDPQRLRHYHEKGDLRGLPVDRTHWNVCADYRINATLIETQVGEFSRDWLLAPDVTANDVAEDIYVRKWDGGQHQPQSGQGQGQGKGDEVAKANGGRFDEVLEPQTDPVTGAEDLPSEMEFKEAVARAAAAAKAMGKLPGHLARMVEELLEPKIDWREHLRMLLVGAVGSAREAWARPNRRRLVLSPLIILPGKRGHGAGTIAVMLDTSGSIYCSPKVLEAFFAELTAILADIHPKRVVMIECDAAIQAVHELERPEDMDERRSAGVMGGGGTSFVPPFEWLAEHGIVPDAAVYLTDLMGTFPEKPAYPVIWATTHDLAIPFGQKVMLPLDSE